MRHLNLNSKTLWFSSIAICFALYYNHHVFGQTDSIKATNPAFDSLIRHIADSLFREMEKAVPPVPNVQQRTGTATQQDVVNFSDIAKLDSLNRNKPVKGKPIHRPLNPVELWYERTLDSLRKAFDTIRIKTKPPVDSAWQDTTAQHQSKSKVLPREQKNVPSKQPKVNLSPPPDRNFSALEDDNSGITPPDVSGAAGPAHLMVTLNTQVRIQDRQGTVISTVSLPNWWAGLGATIVFDPRVLFDPYSRRWIFVACADYYSANSSILIAVSQTDNPTGPWNRYRFDVDPLNIDWADFPSVGFNKKWICVSLNMFPVAGGLYRGMNIYAFDKADLYRRGTGRFRLFEFRQPILGTDFTRAPMITHDDTLSVLYLMRSSYGDDSAVYVYSISGNLGSEIISTGTRVDGRLSAWGGAGTGDIAPQLGTGHRIHAGDWRMQNVVYRNGSLWCTHSVFFPPLGTTRSSIQWWQLYALSGLTGMSILQQGRIDDPTNNRFYACPSISVNTNNSVLIGHSRFSAAQYASGNYSFRTVADPDNTMQPDTVLKDGEAPYYKFDGTHNRWGDYTTTTTDPLNDFAIWTIQEYAESPFPRWGTWWGRIGDLHCPVAPGDLNVNGSITPVDAVLQLNAAYRNGTFPAPFCTADLNCNRSLTIGDVDLMLTLTYLGQQPPACGYQY